MLLKGGRLYSVSRPQYLRRETKAALDQMVAAFKKDHPAVPVQIVSTTRNFVSQKGIWERKWQASSIKPGPDRARKILEYSSMPATSRHHWGTDIDFNQLNNTYYRRGEGKVFYDWMVSHAARFGFCQPYTASRQGEGYQEERWHWSYRPLSVVFLKEWLSLPPTAFAGVNFAGSEHFQKLSRLYVSNVDPSCR
ncbi:MAG: M15 family metallopeptidase [Spirochaetales bacterium]|nr:M15 family metallopeptidase [Spirochaetales bacterium]